MKEKILFKEEQSMRQWWLWLLLFGILAFFIYGDIQQIVFKVPFGNKPAPDMVLIITTIGMLGLCYFFYQLKLITTITEEYIHIKYSFLVDKKVKWKDIKQATIIQYGFVGYGLRLSFKHGTVYNASGNKGLQIQSKYGKFVVGTQKPEELKLLILNV